VTRSEILDSSGVTELRKQLSHATKLLSKTTEELNETRQRLSDVQERLTVAKQLTAATQQRALRESGNSEQLQLELTLQHQPITSTGRYRWVLILNNHNITSLHIIIFYRYIQNFRILAPKLNYSSSLKVCFEYEFMTFHCIFFHRFSKGQAHFFHRAFMILV